MSPKQKSKRLTAVAVANAINGTEGVPVSDKSKELARKWTENVITGEDMINELVIIYKRSAE